MSFEIPQDNQAKIHHLTAVKELIAIELYRYCLATGFDVETFNYEEYATMELNGIKLNENSSLLKVYSQKMVKIEEKIKELNVRE